MRLQILNQGEEGLTGYEKRVITDNKVDLSEVSDNECDEILLGGSPFSLPHSELVGFFVLVSSKLRKGGVLRFSGVDSRMVARGLINGTMSDEQFNSIIYHWNSILSIPEVKNLLHGLGLKISTLTIRGLDYEVEASR